MGVASRVVGGVACRVVPIVVRFDHSMAVVAGGNLVGFGHDPGCAVAALVVVGIALVDPVAVMIQIATVDIPVSVRRVFVISLILRRVSI